MAATSRKDFVFLCQNRLKCVCALTSICCSAIIFSWIRSLWGANGICIYVTFANGLWLWSIHSCEDNVLLNQSFSVLLSSSKTCWSSLCTCFIPWDSVEIWQLDSSLFLFVFLIAVLQCKHLQKTCCFYTLKSMNPQGSTRVWDEILCTEAEQASCLRWQNGCAAEVFCSV